MLFLDVTFYQQFLFSNANTGKGKKTCRLARIHWAFFFQPGVQNELFNSKQAFSWLFVCFDLRIRSLHECLYCHVLFPQCVNYWKECRSRPASSGYVYTTSLLDGQTGLLNPQMLLICPVRSRDCSSRLASPKYLVWHKLWGQPLTSCGLMPKPTHPLHSLKQQKVKLWHAAHIKERILTLILCLLNFLSFFPHFTFCRDAQEPVSVTTEPIS